MAEHWIESHYEEVVTVQEARSALESHPERFRRTLTECLVEVAEEEVLRRLTIREPDDGYEIRHSPAVPRVRSAPSESIIYVEHEAVTMLDREVEELFRYEGLDVGDDVSVGQSQTVRIELRFCNIQDGYIPLVGNVRSILPPLLVDGEIVEVSWHAESEAWFQCKVSRSKRAIYNIERKLKDLFKREQLPSGVWLYITRVETRRYQIGVRRSPHVVPDCKVFFVDDNGAWNVVRQNEFVEWETSEHVFKHSLNFAQMEALHREAQVTPLSVRDAVYEVMNRLARSEAVHVRTVHDAVFWRRNCSLAAVWAQFRPENTCYERVEPGLYRLRPTEPRPPTIRTITPHVHREDALPPARRQRGRYVVKQRHTWRFNVFKSRFEEEIENDQDACLTVQCAFGTPHEVCFKIPIRELKERVLLRAHCHEGGRYMFTVNPHDYVFRWDYNVEMPGKAYLE